MLRLGQWAAACTVVAALLIALTPGSVSAQSASPGATRPGASGPADGGAAPSDQGTGPSSGESGPAEGFGTIRPQQRGAPRLEESERAPRSDEGCPYRSRSLELIV